MHDNFFNWGKKLLLGAYYVESSMLGDLVE